MVDVANDAMMLNKINSLHMYLLSTDYTPDTVVGIQRTEKNPLGSQMTFTKADSGLEGSIQMSVSQGENGTGTVDIKQSNSGTLMDCAGMEVFILQTPKKTG